MTYIDEFETELRKKLEAGEKADAIISWCREKVLESYRNGVTTLRTRTRSPRKDSNEEKKESAEALKGSAQSHD